MPEPADELRREVQRLRDWRHDTQPRVVTLEQLTLDVRGRVAKLEENVAKIVEEDRIAAAVAQRLGQRRGVLLSRSEKVLGFALALPGVVAICLQLADRFG